MEYFFFLSMIENNTEHSLTISFIKKFGPTKFFSVRQSLEFCQADVWQNSRDVFPQHWKTYLEGSEKGLFEQMAV